ncbi:PEPxxWA-CTERM sorting domain-containing protein [Thermaurantiacus sp.]
MWTTAASPIVATADFPDLPFVNGLSISKGSINGGQWADVVNPATTYSFNPVRAVGFDLDMGPSGFDTGHIWTVHFVGGGTHVLAEINRFVGFYGIVSSLPVNKLTVAAGTACCIETCSLDNMGFGAVPEAGTWAMLVAGFGLVGTAVRRRCDALAA